MRTLKYSIVCEDDAQFWFLQSLLRHPDFLNPSLHFDERFYKRFYCSNRKLVKGRFAQIVNEFSFLNEWNLDLVFVGIDYDDRDRNDFEKELKALHNELSENGRKKALIYYPVQCIEHWLLFLKTKENKDNKKIPKKIEGIPRLMAKKLFYESSKRGEHKELIEELMASSDLEWLCHQSLSFRLFYNRLREILK